MSPRDLSSASVLTRLGLMRELLDDLEVIGCRVLAQLVDPICTVRPLSDK